VCLQVYVWQSGRLDAHVLSSGAPLGRQYGTLCSALAIAERQRDAGRHTLVVLDDISCMVWCCHSRGDLLACKST
jgi:F0F1-type ATP synthase alpha subunit